MSSLQDLLAQRADIEKKIADAQREARAEAVAKVKAMMAEFGRRRQDRRIRTLTPWPRPTAGTLLISMARPRPGLFNCAASWSLSPYAGWPVDSLRP